MCPLNNDRKPPFPQAYNLIKIKPIVVRNIGFIFKTWLDKLPKIRKFCFQTELSSLLKANWKVQVYIQSEARLVNAFYGYKRLVNN